MFRFTIRDVLWLTVVVGVALTMGLAWRADSERHKEIEISLRKLIHEIRGLYLDELRKSGQSPLDVKRDWEEKKKQAAKSD